MTDSRLDRWIREALRGEEVADRDAPVEEMWARIEAEVESSLRAHRLRHGEPGRTRRRRTGRRWLGAPAVGWAVAATVLIAVASATLVVSQRAEGPDAGTVAGEASSPALAVIGDYERAIADMQEELASSGGLGYAAGGDLAQALEAVDQAIEETRVALQGSPSDHYYQSHLIRNLELKLSILEGSLRL